MKAAFVLDPAVTFGNHSAFGACPRAGFALFQARQLEVERNPVGFSSRRSAQLLAAARAESAARLGTSAAQRVFVPNATDVISPTTGTTGTNGFNRVNGVNRLARSLALQPRDAVLTTDH